MSNASLCPTCKIEGCDYAVPFDADDIRHVRNVLRSNGLTLSLHHFDGLVADRAALVELVREFAKYVEWANLGGPRAAELLERAKAVKP